MPPAFLDDAVMLPRHFIDTGRFSGHLRYESPGRRTYAVRPGRHVPPMLEGFFSSHDIADLFDYPALYLRYISRNIT